MEASINGYVVKYISKSGDYFHTARGSCKPQIYSTYGKAKRAFEDIHRKEGIHYNIHQITCKVDESTIVKGE